ncbi:MAG: hypothetical protein GY759_04720 [Chloroflexi bacterium]|nr:hypothetical protein [Chloroflexota bacterium]
MSRRKIALLAILALMLTAAIGAGVVWQQFSFGGEIQGPIADSVDDYRFDLFGYELGSVSGKLADMVRRPGVRLAPEEQIILVEHYQYRATHMGWLQNQISRIYADPDIADPEASSRELSERLAGMAAIQADTRPSVEAILERQVREMLVMMGFSKGGVVWPPARFNFSDLPNYLIVSPRDRIEVEAGIHLHPDIPLSEIDFLEGQVADEFDRSTIIEDLGGLGVWPTMVMDQASLSWILSTIAHEWVHNYLVFQPLGWHLFDGQEMNTINETVATIVGDEIGDRLAFEYYGIPTPPPLPPLDDEELIADADPDQFDVRREMRRTRLRVDELLEEGNVEEAEAYMETRRQMFVEEGYYLRKLNQAYFAFHGSYATRPAASDPIGPKLRELRSLTPDLATFMRLVQEISAPEQLDEILAIRRGEHGVAAPKPDNQ